MLDKLKMLNDLRKLQNEMAQQENTGTAENGLVTIKMNGSLKTTSVNIDPQLLTIENIDRLEKAIMIASNDALEKSQQSMASQLKNSGLNFPF